MKALHFFEFCFVLLLSVIAIGIGACGDGYYSDPVSGFCLSCADLCSPGRDSFTDCSRLCPGFGTTKRSPITTTTTTTTTPTTPSSAPTKDSARSSIHNVTDYGEVVGRDGPSARVEAQLSDSPKDNGKMILGQHVTITMVAVLIAICLVLLFAFISYKTQLHTKMCKGDSYTVRNPERGVSYRPGRNTDQNTVVNFEEAEARVFLRSQCDNNEPHSGQMKEINPSNLPIPTHPDTTNNAIPACHVHVGPTGINNPNFESSNNSNRSSDPGYASDTIVPKGFPVLQSGVPQPSPNFHCTLAPEPLPGHTYGGAIVGIPDDDSEDDRNTSPKELV